MTSPCRLFTPIVNRASHPATSAAFFFCFLPRNEKTKHTHRSTRCEIFLQKSNVLQARPTKYCYKTLRPAAPVRMSRSARRCSGGYSAEPVIFVAYNAEMWRGFGCRLSSRSSEGLIVKKKGGAESKKQKKKNTRLVLIWIQWPGITGPWRALVSNGICDREQGRGINMLHLTCGHNTSP